MFTPEYKSVLSYVVHNYVADKFLKRRVCMPLGGILFSFCMCMCISRFGLAGRLVSKGNSVRIRFGSPLSSKVVVCRHCLVTLSLTINETLKWLSSLPIVMHESFWWWGCSDRYINSLPTPHNPPPFSPSLISLMVSVDVKHDVYWPFLFCFECLPLVQFMYL